MIKTSNVNEQRPKCTTPYFHEEKENLYTKTFDARMQENPSCPGCPKWCGEPFTENYCTNCSGRDKNVENLYVNEDELGYNKQEYVTVLNPRRAGRSADSARGSMYGCDQINVEDVPLYKDINKKRVCEPSDNQQQADKSGSSLGNHRNCTMSETWPSKQPEMCHVECVKKFHEDDPVEQISCGGSYYKIDDITCSETVRSSCESDRKSFHIVKEKKELSYNESHRIEDMTSPEKDKCNIRFNENTTGNSKGEKNQSQKSENSEDVESNLGKGKTLDPEKDYPQTVDRSNRNLVFAKDERKSCRKCTSSEDVESSLEKGKTFDPRNNYPKRVDKNETNASVAKDERKTSRKYTSREEIESNLDKGKTLDPQKDYIQGVDKNETKVGIAKDSSKECTRGNEEVKSNIRNRMSMDSKTDDLRTGKNSQEENIADRNKQSASVKAEKTDAKTAYKSEAVQHDQAKSAKHGEGAKPAGRDKSKVSRGSKRMPRRRVQRKPQTHHSCNVEKPASGGVGEWLLFIFDSIKKGVLSAISGIPSYLSAGWSLLAYFLVVLTLLVLLVLSGIRSFLKSCAVCLCGVPLFLRTWVRSLRDRNFRKEDNNANDAFRQQSGPLPARQRSDPLPEANKLVSKLLASKDLDAYEILGVSPSATDEEIKRNYRDMAKVVHPDKNPHEDASEAFKILQSAFDAISDEQKRLAYKFNNDKKRLQEEMEEFFENFMEKVQEMKNKIVCHACQKSHPRLPTDRLIFSARYCSDCGVRHPAKEGDVWVETSHMGFKYYCFLCMNGQVYEVTEWGSCQGLLRLKANSHHVFISVRSDNHSPWDDMFGEDDRSSNNKKKRKSKGKSNKNKKR